MPLALTTPDWDCRRPPGAGHGRWREGDAPSARAASLASSAALPVPARPCAAVVEAVDPYASAFASPYASPYAGHRRTPSPRGGRITAGHAPSGEWSGRAGWCASRGRFRLSHLGCNFAQGRRVRTGGGGEAGRLSEGQYPRAGQDGCLDPLPGPGNPGVGPAQRPPRRRHVPGGGPQRRPRPGGPGRIDRRHRHEGAGAQRT
jgi:hypothetical protein